MATKIGRSLDEIKNKSKELNAEVRSLTNQNKLLDRSLKFEKNPFETLTKRAENTKQSITAVTQRIELLKEQQKEYQTLLDSGQIKQSTYDKLATDIARTEMQLSQLNAELEETNKTIALLPAQKFKELGTAIEGAGNKLKGLSATAGAVLGGLTAIGLSANKTADDLGTLAGKLGITAEELQYLLYIAEKTDVSADQMQKSFVKVKDAIGTQLLGETNSAVKALEMLGIVASDFDNDLDAFYAVGDALGRIEDGAVQAALANDIFGAKIGFEMTNFLNAGKDALKGYENELTNVGILSNEAVNSVNGFNDSIDRIKESFKLAKNELGLALLPVMEQIAGFLEDKFIPFINNLVEKFSKLSDETKGIIIGVLGFLTVLAPLLIVIGKVTSGIGGIIELLPKLSGLLTSLSAHPIIAILGLVAVLLTTLYAKNETFRNSVNKLFSVLSKALQPILELVANLLGTIMDLITPLINALAGPLSTVLNAISVILEPIATLVGWIVDGIKWIIDVGLAILGKGWLWGTDSTTTEVVDTTSNSHSSSSATLDVNVSVDATGDSTLSKSNADVVAESIAEKVNEILGGKTKYA